MAVLFNFLKKNYPFNDDLKQNIKLIFSISIVLLILLFLFQPFDLKSLDKQEKYLLIGGIIIVNFAGLSINLLLVPAYLSKTRYFKKWTVLKEILWNIWILFTLVTGYYLYFLLTGVFSFSLYILFKILIISIIPISILIPYNRNRLLRKHLQSALELNRYLEEKAHPSPKIIHLKSDYEKDSLSIDANKLLYIHSASNYIEVYWLENKNIRSQMVRCTLTSAEVAVREYPFIFKCHRAYIVNINHVIKVVGNSQGYSLYVGDNDHIVTVSRSYIPAFKDLFYKL